jgi:deoxyribonuclease V
MPVGRTLTIAFLDVGYTGAQARAACVLADSGESEVPDSTYLQDIDAVEPYDPGNFFRRELPRLLSVLRVLPSLPEVAVVDGYVCLSPARRPGLGAHLYDALGRRVPVVGIAKTAFVGARSCNAVAQVIRGRSRQPLFVTAAGMELADAERGVRRMAGKHRIPEMMRIVDRLSRNTD